MPFFFVFLSFLVWRRLFFVFFCLAEAAFVIVTGGLSMTPGAEELLLMDTFWRLGKGNDKKSVSESWIDHDSCPAAQWHLLNLLFV